MRIERININKIPMPPSEIHALDDDLLELAPAEEKRTAMAPVPTDLPTYLNDEQLMALRTMEYFGWRLAFIRRNNLPESITVIMNTDTLSYATIEPNGHINESPVLKIRA